MKGGYSDLIYYKIKEICEECTSSHWGHCASQTITLPFRFYAYAQTWGSHFWDRNAKVTIRNHYVGNTTLCFVIHIAERSSLQQLAVKKTYGVEQEHVFCDGIQASLDAARSLVPRLISMHPFDDYLIRTLPAGTTDQYIETLRNGDRDGA